MPYIRIFEMEYEIISSKIDDISLTCTGLNSLFVSSFWHEHQWFFNHRQSLVLRGAFYGPSYVELYNVRIIFYSTNLYK